MPIRVLRVMEYTYPDVERMEADMARWQVPSNGQKFMGIYWRIKSATMPLEILMEDNAETDTGV